MEQVIPKGAVAAELGVHRGAFTRCLLEVTKPEKLHLIDPWYLLGEEWRCGRGNQSTIDALVGVLCAYAEELSRGEVAVHIGYDLEVLETFPDHYFDWVYLDTTHKFEQTQKELQLLKRKVKLDGIIAGDDWLTNPDDRHHGVCRAVREFVEAEPYRIIYADEADKQWAIRRDT